MSRKTHSEPRALVIGDRVKRRGLGFEGEVSKFGDDPSWVYVKWDDGPKPKDRPEICSRSELE